MENGKELRRLNVDNGEKFEPLGASPICELGFSTDVAQIVRWQQ